MQYTQKSFFKLAIITVALFLGAIVFTYGKNNTSVVSGNSHVIKYTQGFKPVSYPDLNPADLVATTNMRLHTA